jgi:hypothetical protein
MRKKTEYRLEQAGASRRRALGLAGVPAAILLLLAAVAVAAGTGSARPTAAPSNTAPPTISGKAQSGSTLQAANGTWSGTAPITYSYQWRICNENGGACHDIAGAMGNEYTLKAGDAGNSVRVQVTAKNAEGSATSTSVPSARIASAPATTTTSPSPSPSPSGNGCPAGGGTIAVAGLSAPARMSIDQFTVSPGTLTHGTRTLTARFHVTACGGPVQGAMIYATAVPYGMFPVPNEQPTGSDGWATLDFRATGFPVSAKQQLLVMFVRARKSGENVLGGVSTRRLVSFKVAR